VPVGQATVVDDRSTLVGVPPLATLSDDQLWNAQLILALGCGRAKNTLKGKQREVLCFLANVLKVEADLRGLPSPVAPYHASQAKGEAL